MSNRFKRVKRDQQKVSGNQPVLFASLSLLGQEAARRRHTVMSESPSRREPDREPDATVEPFDHLKHFETFERFDFETSTDRSQPPPKSPLMQSPSLHRQRPITTAAAAAAITPQAKQHQLRQNKQRVQAAIHHLHARLTRYERTLQRNRARTKQIYQSLDQFVTTFDAFIDEHLSEDHRLSRLVSADTRRTLDARNEYTVLASRFDDDVRPPRTRVRDFLTRLSVYAGILLSLVFMAPLHAVCSLLVKLLVSFGVLAPLPPVLLPAAPPAPPVRGLPPQPAAPGRHPRDDPPSARAPADDEDDVFVDSLECQLEPRAPADVPAAEGELAVHEDALRNGDDRLEGGRPGWAMPADGDGDFQTNCRFPSSSQFWSFSPEDMQLDSLRTASRLDDTA